MINLLISLNLSHLGISFPLLAFHAAATSLSHDQNDACRMVNDFGVCNADVKLVTLLHWRAFYFQMERTSTQADKNALL